MPAKLYYQWFQYLSYFRQENEELFQQNLFRVLCGCKPFSEKIKAKKYRVQEQFLTRHNFMFIMKNLPEKVSLSCRQSAAIRSDNVEKINKLLDLSCPGC